MYNNKAQAVLLQMPLEYRLIFTHMSMTHRQWHAPAAKICVLFDLRANYLELSTLLDRGENSSNWGLVFHCFVSHSPISTESDY